MKKIFILFALFMFLVSCNREKIISDCENEDFAVQIVSYGGEFGDEIRFSGKYDFSLDISPLNPWKVEICDIDGGEYELALGVYKESPHHQVMAKRVFFYNIGDERLIPKFRASRTSLPFEDFFTYDIDGDSFDELITIEKNADGEKMLGAYNWNNFRMTRDYESEFLPSEFNIIKSDKLYIEIDGREREIKLNDEKIYW